ncbi:MAG: hypothetical protein ABSF60_12285 [Verrucomicrobiota bacterium]
MHLLYKAYACVVIGDSKVLLPGAPVQFDMLRPKSGDKIELELADGTCLQTTVMGTKCFDFDESTVLPLRTKPGYYCAIQVPDDLSPPGIELGAKVFLVDPATNAASGGNG